MPTSKRPGKATAGEMWSDLTDQQRGLVTGCLEVEHPYCSRDGKQAIDAAIAVLREAARPPRKAKVKK